MSDHPLNLVSDTVMIDAADGQGITLVPPTVADEGTMAFNYARRGSGTFGQTGDRFGVSAWYLAGGPPNEHDLEINNKLRGLATGSGGESGKAVLSLTAEGWDSTGAGSAGPSIGLTLTSNPSGSSQIGIAGDMRSADKYFERSRTVAMGEWTTFTPSLSASAGTWTSATVNRAAYMLIGKTMFVQWELDSSNVSSAPNELLITIPGGGTANASTRNTFQAIDAGGTATTGLARVVASGTVIRLQPTIAGTTAWTTTAGNNTSVRGQISFELA